MDSKNTTNATDTNNATASATSSDTTPSRPLPIWRIMGNDYERGKFVERGSRTVEVPECDWEHAAVQDLGPDQLVYANGRVFDRLRGRLLEPVDVHPLIIDNALLSPDEFRAQVKEWFRGRMNMVNWKPRRVTYEEMEEYYRFYYTLKPYEPDTMIETFMPKSERRASHDYQDNFDHDYQEDTQMDADSQTILPTDSELLYPLAPIAENPEQGTPAAAAQVIQDAGYQGAAACITLVSEITAEIEKQPYDWNPTPAERDEWRNNRIRQLSTLSQVLNQLRELHRPHGVAIRPRGRPKKYLKTTGPKL